MARTSLIMVQYILWVEDMPPPGTFEVTALSIAYGQRRVGKVLFASAQLLTVAVMLAYG